MLALKLAIFLSHQALVTLCLALDLESLISQEMISLKSQGRDCAIVLFNDQTGDDNLATFLKEADQATFVIDVSTEIRIIAQTEPSTDKVILNFLLPYHTAFFLN